MEINTKECDEKVTKMRTYDYVPPKPISFDVHGFDEIEKVEQDDPDFLWEVINRSKKSAKKSSKWMSDSYQSCQNYACGHTACTKSILVTCT